MALLNGIRVLESNAYNVSYLRLQYYLEIILLAKFSACRFPFADKGFQHTIQIKSIHAVTRIGF